MSIESKAHDLTILYMSQIANMKNVVTQEDYVLKYNEVRERFEAAFQKEKPSASMMPDIKTIEMNR